MSRFALGSMFILPLLALAQGPAIPEPPSIIYGVVFDGNSPQEIPVTSVTWQITGGGESGVFTLASAPATRIVAQDGHSFYLLEMPFETRVVRTGPTASLTLTRQGQSFANVSPAAAYTLTPVINGRAAMLRSLNGSPTSGSSFALPSASASASGSSRSFGQMLRLDLSLPTQDAYAAWAAGYFGNTPNAARTADPDGDGVSNEDEYNAGTNPTDRNSSLSLVASALQANGSLLLTFRTVPGKHYRLRASSDLIVFAPIGAPLTATATTSQFTIAQVERQFFKLEVIP